MVALATDNGRGLTTSVQVIAVLAIGIGLAVKTPMWPLHSWLPDAHTAAPTVGSVLLAGVLLKMGTYGFVRILLPITPDGMHTFAPYLAAFAVVGIVYGSLACLALARQGAKGDLKRLIAYSSVGHMGFVLLGIATMTPTGVNGALFANIAHGLITGLLFFLVGAAQGPLRHRRPRHPRRRHRSRPLRPAPRLGGLLAFAAVASLGLPGPRRILGRDARAVRRLRPGRRASAAPPSSPSWRSPRSAPCSPPRTCSSSYAASAWATKPRRNRTGLADVQTLRVRRLDPARRPHRPRRPVARGPPRPHRPGRAEAPRRRQVVTTAADSTTSLVQSVDWLAIAPPVIAAVVALIVLVADLFLPEATQAAPRLACHRRTRRRPRSPAPAARRRPLHLLPHRRRRTVCSYTADHFTLVIQVLVLGGALLTALLSFGDTRKNSPPASSGSCCCPPPRAPPCCPPPATSPPSSSPSKSPPCPPSPSSASSAATGAPPRRP